MVDPVPLSLLTFCVGLIVGHRLSIGRDKRKEYNVAAARIIATLESRLAGRYVDLAGPDDWIVFEHLLPPLKRGRWQRARKAYEDALTDTVREPTYSSVSNRNPDNVTARLKELVALISLR